MDVGLPRGDIVGSGGAMLPTEYTLLRAFTAARWMVLGWMAVVTWLQRDELARGWVAAAGLAVPAAFAAASTILLSRARDVLLTRTWAVGDLTLAFTLLVADGVAYQDGHAFAASQNLAGNWPFLSAVVAAVVIGPRFGALGGALVAMGRAVGAEVNGISVVDTARLPSIGGTVVAYTIAGGTLGWMAARLREVETEVAAQRARDEVAATLHDGVLQTLAIVAKRCQDSLPEVATLVRKTDRELRRWLFGAAPDQQDLASVIKNAASEVGVLFDASVTVSVIGDEVAVNPRVIQAAAGVVREAVTNAAKHAAAAQIVVFAEVEESGSLFLSVHDNGCGFDVDLARRRRGSGAAGQHGVGLERSIYQRVASVGGRVEIDSVVGQGTELNVWIP